MKYPSDFLKAGGQWLGSLRTEIQTMFLNGESVTWGSIDRVSHIPSVKDLEKLGACAVTGYHNEVVEPMIETMRDARAILRGQLEVCRKDDREVIEKAINKLSMRIDNKPEWMAKIDETAYPK